MSKPHEAPRIERAADGTIEVHLPGTAQPYRIVAWNPPRLRIAHGDDVREAFLAASKDELWAATASAGTVLVPRRRCDAEAAAVVGGREELTSPMPGKVLALFAKEGERVQAGQRLLVIEAMKMENPIRAPHDAVVKTLHVRAGDAVQAGQPLIELEDAK